MKERYAALLGFVVAPLIPASILSVAYPLSGHREPSDIAASLMVALPFSSIFCMGLGLPAFLILRRFGPGHWWSVAAIGFLLGTVAAFFVSPVLQPMITLIYGSIGAATALVFWIIWRRGRQVSSEVGV
jgi:hypothetical protein